MYHYEDKNKWNCVRYYSVFIIDLLVLKVMFMTG